MANVTLRIHTAKAVAIAVSGKVECVADLPRLFAKASAAIKQAAQVLPDVAGSKVERISFGDSEASGSKPRKSSGETHAPAA
jgi:hypothetical protein